MPINSMIPMGYQGIQLQNPMDLQNKMMQLQSAENQNALAQYQLNAAKRTDSLNEGMLNYMNSPDFKPEGLQKFGAPGLAAIKSINEAKNAGLTGQKLQGEISAADFKLKNDKVVKAITDISALSSPEEALKSIDDHLAKGDIDPQKAEMLKTQLSQSPDFGTWRKNMVLGILDAKSRLELTAPKTTYVAAGGVSIPTQTNPLAEGYAVPTTIAHTAVPSTEAALISARAAQSQAQTAKERLTFQKEQAGPETGLTPEARTLAAERYRIDGTLPPLGHGAAAVKARNEILNDAARMSAESGDTPGAERIRQLVNKSSSAALTQLGKQEASVGAFEKTFNKNADLAIDAAKKMDQSGSPIAQKWIQAGRRAGVGAGPELAAFDIYIKSALNEYSKIISGSMGNTQTAVSEIERVNKLLNTAMNTEDVVAALAAMKQETQNRMTSFKDQKEEITSSMKPVTAPRPAGGKVVEFSSLSK